MRHSFSSGHEEDDHLTGGVMLSGVSRMIEMGGRLSFIAKATIVPDRKVSAPTDAIAHANPNRSAINPAPKAPMA